MSKTRIKKNKSEGFKGFWKKLTVLERMFVFIPMVALLGLVAYLVFAPGVTLGAAGVNNGIVLGQYTHTNRQLILETEGNWETFEDYNVDVYLPRDIPALVIKDEILNQYHKIHVTKDKGNYPEIAVGVAVSPDIENLGFDLLDDASAAMDIVTPLLQEALSEVTKGINPTMTVDLLTLELIDGVTVLEGSGEAEVVVLYQDPKDENNKWAEPLVTNLYYNITTLDGRPVVTWGIWDWIIYEGEAKIRAAVQDATKSIMRSAGMEILLDEDVVVTSTPESPNVEDIESTN